MATATISFNFELPAESEELQQASSWGDMASSIWDAKQKLFHEIDENDSGLNWTTKQLQFLRELMEVLNWDK